MPVKHFEVFTDFNSHIKVQPEIENSLSVIAPGQIVS